MDFDSLQDDSAAQAATAPPVKTPIGNQPPNFDDLQDDSEKYGTPEQMAKTFGEGALKGTVGPLAPFLEQVGGVKAQDIRGRQTENPITHGVGEAAGIGAGIASGTGLGGAMTGVGKAAAGASAFGDVLAAERLTMAAKAAATEGLPQAAELAAQAADATKGLTYAHKVGSAAVQQAAEMAVLQGSDEAAKMIVQDPDSSAESAISNVGMAAALGAGGGAFMSGVASPLWKATVGPKAEEFLSLFKNHVNGATNAILPEARESAINALGIEVDPLMRAGMTDNLKARDYFGTLRRGENSQVLEAIDKLHNDASNSVMQSLGIDPEEITHYSSADAGHDVLDSFKREYKAKYEPIADAMEKRNAEAATLPVPDEDRMQQYSNLLEKGISNVGTDSPYYKLYHEYGDRLLAKDTIGGMDSLKTEINNRIKGLKMGGDHNIINALNDIKSSINDFQEKQIAGNALNKVGSEGAELIARRAAANKSYSQFAKMSDDLTNHLNIGDFKGAGSLTNKLDNKLTAEQILNKFSIRNNADFTPFLQQHFPETLEKVLENERKQVIKPAVLQAAKKGENPIDISKMSDIINKHLAGKSDYIRSIIPPEALSKIEAAKTLINSVPNPRNSGTPAGMAKLFSHIPTGALAAVGWMTGHNPLVSGLLGETASRVGQGVPEAYRLAYLKFLASDQPVNSSGFKAMVNFLHNSYKGENTLSKAASAIFKSGSQVLASNLIPSASDREKLDKQVSKLQDMPNQFMQNQDGHVGTYLPPHQVGLTKTTGAALQYLQSLKPQPVKPSPLDKEIPPAPAQTARYNRALDIAQQPAIILQHIKDGTLQASDIQDLHSIYPGIYKNLNQKLSNEITEANSRGETVPYHTRVALSLFLGQPLDSTMNPMSIIAAQPKSQGSPHMPQPQEPMKGRKGPGSLGKSNSSYQTADQAAESRRNTKD